MITQLIQVQQRICELESLADEIGRLVDKYYLDDGSIDCELSQKGQKWYRGCREILAHNKLSALGEFEECYRSPSQDHRDAYYNLDHVLSAKSRRQIGMTSPQFWDGFRKARSLVLASTEELLSRELPIATRLSFSMVQDEFEKAAAILADNRSDEVMIRASGVVARVALERHLWTIADSRNLTVAKNPPNKKHADVNDLLTTLVKEVVITQVQRSHLDSLFAVGNNCAHPKEVVRADDVGRLISEGRSLSAAIP